MLKTAKRIATVAYNIDVSSTSTTISDYIPLLVKWTRAYLGPVFYTRMVCRRAHADKGQQCITEDDHTIISVSYRIHDTFNSEVDYSCRSSKLKIGNWEIDGRLAVHEIGNRVYELYDIRGHVAVLQNLC